MRSLFVLATLGLASAYSSEKTGECLVDGGEAINDAADGALFIWAAYKRCGKPGLEVKCTVDVASALQSVNSMVNIILKTLDKCEALKVANAECGLSAGLLTKSFAGLSAASADVVQKCPNHPGLNLAANQEDAATFPDGHLVFCTTDIKDGAKSIFKVVNEFRKVTKNCKKGGDPRPCISNAMRIVGGLSALGEYLSGAIGHCSKTSNMNAPALCSQAASAIVHNSAKVAAAATDMSRKCAKGYVPASSKDNEPVLTEVVEVEVPRLYDEHGEVAKTPATASSANLILGAFLPVTALVGFVGGRIYARRRVHSDRELTTFDVAAYE